MEYFNYVRSMIASYTRSTRKIKCMIVMAKKAFYRKKNRFTSKLDLHLRKKLME
jgi:hypothetical protein